MLQNKINGIEGTAPESVGILNKENTIKEYAVFVVSEVGSSITQPFINTNTDNFEADENINWAVNFTLMPVGTTVIDMRSMDTLVDNDWYKFTIPNSKNYDTMKFILPALKVEVMQLISLESTIELTEIVL